jgi:hypothetical protein
MAAPLLPHRHGCLVLQLPPLALQSGDPETISKSMIVLATIRTWLHEVANDGFALT